MKASHNNGKSESEPQEDNIDLEPEKVHENRIY